MDIDGVIISKLRTIKDERGQVMPMLTNDSPVFKSFGEVYFSTIYENKIKAWHLHKESYLNYVCVVGEVKLVLFDDRKGSVTKDQYQEIFLSPNNYFLVTIPPNIWNGFKGMGKNESIISNCLTLPHNEKEMIRREPKDNYFSYNW